MFDAMYSARGRPSVPPERLLKASLLMAFYSVRSERLFCEQLDHNLMFRWFLDMSMVEDSLDHRTFSLNRQRLLEHDVAARFFAAVVEQARCARLMSDEHFTVDVDPSLHVHRFAELVGWQIVGRVHAMLLAQDAYLKRETSGLDASLADGDVRW